MPDIDFQKIVLNLIPKKGDEPVIFYASQYETTRPFIADLFWGDTEFEPGDECWAEIDIRKNDDNLVVITDDVSIDNNEVSVILPVQAVTCIGKNLGQVKIYAGEAQLIAALNFILEVQPDPLAGGVTSESDIDNLTQQIEDIAHEVIGEDYYDKTEVDGLLADKADKSELPDMDDYYTKSEADTLLSDKADKSELPDMDDYYTKSEADSLLSDKADKSDTYTKDQVDLMLSEMLPVGTASGSIATFETALSDNVVELTAIINPVQSGSGTPSPVNPRPISGFTECNIVDCGVNLWDEETELGQYNMTTGLPQPNNYCIRGINRFSVLPNTIYYGVNNNVRRLYYDENDNFISGDYGQGPKITPANARYMRIYLSDAYGTDYNNDVSINYSATDTDYHAYNGNLVTVAFGQTVYGGVLTCKNGAWKVRVTHRFVLLDGVNNRVTGAYGSDAQRLVGYNISDSVGKGSSLDIKCNILTPSNSVLTTDDSIGFGDNFTKIVPHIAGYQGVGGTYPTTADLANAINAWLSSNNVEVCYELATPIEIDLTAEQVATLVGLNNVYHDCNGDISVSYKDTIQHYIDTRL